MLWCWETSGQNICCILHSILYINTVHQCVTGKPIFIPIEYKENNNTHFCHLVYSEDLSNQFCFSFLKWLNCNDSINITYYYIQNVVAAPYLSDAVIYTVVLLYLLHLILFTLHLKPKDLWIIGFKMWTLEASVNSSVLSK